MLLFVIWHSMPNTLNAFLGLGNQNIFLSVLVTFLLYGGDVWPLHEPDEWLCSRNHTIFLELVIPARSAENSLFGRLVLHFASLSALEFKLIHAMKNLARQCHQQISIVKLLRIR